MNYKLIAQAIIAILLRSFIFFFLVKWILNDVDGRLWVGALIYGIIGTINTISSNVGGAESKTVQENIENLNNRVQKLEESCKTGK